MFKCSTAKGKIARGVIKSIEYLMFLERLILMMEYKKLFREKFFKENSSQ